MTKADIVKAVAESTGMEKAAVISAIVLLALAIVLTFYFDHKNMLPE